MAGDDVLWKKVDAMRRPQQSPSPSAIEESENPQPDNAETMIASNSDTTNGVSNGIKPRLNNGSMPARVHATDNATVIPRHHNTTTRTLIETLRKAVKRVGKEAATHRFTQTEKQAIADIVYTYTRQGYRTSENEIARIAINWLLWDYQEYGSEGVLASVLQALQE